MERFAALLVDFLRDPRGGTALEYGFIAFLVSIAAVTALRGIGLALDGKYAALLPALQ